MKRRMALAAALVAVCLSALLLRGRGGTFVGSRVAAPDRYELDIERMSGTDTHTLDLQEGDALQVTIAAVAGRLRLDITDPDGDVLYSGNGTEADHFTVNISRSGRYPVSVNARHAQGTIRIRRDGPDRETER